ncbi:pentapeptide repeat-containing protein [Candidatus Viridilinea mediisalina]|uniref:Pentapeptide repeat-containing protein n=1 Tax=Candidatus Viridilinea mediisalina TaxID=2024553 RepID=A0A2A6RHI9_9CHLR|nr:pentapeptide repeat-containing protein [Candidatus Viridilinea mediisalina]PDW02349.1 hypothetical protein CJ255_14450 [Candidatus Viridilinea mediisalina]
MIQSREERIKLLQVVAGELYRTGGYGMRITAMQEVLGKSFTEQQRSDLEAYVRDFIACSFMVRNEDSYRFSHRSLLEYLAASLLALEIKHDAPHLLREVQLTHAVSNWLVDIYRAQDAAQWFTTLWQWIESTKRQPEASAQFLGGNAVSLLLALGAPLAGRDFSYAYLKGGQLADANCQGAIFDHCTLCDVDLMNAVLADACFTSSQFYSGDLTDAQIEGTNFHSCRFEGVIWYSARVGALRLSGSELKLYIKKQEMFAGSIVTEVWFTRPRGGGGGRSGIRYAFA